MLNSRPIGIICVCALLGVLAPAARVEGAFVIYGTHTDHDVADVADLTDVGLSVDLMVLDSVATLTFTNTSEDPEHSAVFKQIVIDTRDDDTDEASLGDGIVLTDPADVSYTIEPYIVLPGYNPVITDGESMIRLAAAAPAPKKGIAPGEVLQVRFATSLPDGSGIADYFDAFGDGDDTAMYSLGFHAISAAILDGESLSGYVADVPEPGTLALIALGIWPVVRRRRP